MSLITVEVARFGHAKKRTKVKLRQGMLWKDFLELLCSKMHMLPNTSLEVTDQRGHSISSTKDLKDKAILILRESSAEEANYRGVEDLSRGPSRQLPKRAHSFGGHDISVYSAVGHSSMSPVMRNRPLPMSPLVPSRPLPRVPSRSSIYSTPAMSPPPPPRSRVASIPVYGSAVLPRKQPTIPPPPQGAMMTVPSHGSAVLPRKQTAPPRPERMVSMPQEGPLALSPLMTRSQAAPHPQLRRYHSQLQVGAAIVNPFICSLTLLEKVSQETDSFVVVAQSKEGDQEPKFYRVKIAFVRTDVQGFRHPYENEVLILQHLRAASNHKSASYVTQSVGSTYCRTREDLALLHQSMRREISKVFKPLMAHTPGMVFITAYPLGLDTLQDKSASKIQPKEVMAYGLEILKCFLFLQQHGVIHRCPVLSKFRISADHRVLLSDFENSVIINSSTLLFHYRNVGPFGTNLSMMSTLAPDVLNTHARHEVAPGYPDDSVNYSGQYPWSFGVLFSILASGNHPLPDYPSAYGPPGQINYWPDQISLSIPEEFPSEVKEGIKQCLSANPNHRCSLHQLLHIFTEAEKECLHRGVLPNGSSMRTSSSSDLQKSSAKEDLYSRPKKAKKHNRRWQTQPVGVNVDQIMQIQLSDPSVTPTVPATNGTVMATPTVHEYTDERTVGRTRPSLDGLRQPLATSSVVDVSSGVENASERSKETDSPFLHSEHKTLNAATVCIPPVDGIDSVTVPITKDVRSDECAEAQVISIDIPDSDEECVPESRRASAGWDVEIKEVSPPIEEPEVISVPVVTTPDSVQSLQSLLSNEGPPPYAAVSKLPVRSERADLNRPPAVPYSQPLPRKLDLLGVAHYHSHDRMNTKREDALLIKPLKANKESKTVFPFASDNSLQTVQRQQTSLSHPKSCSSDRLEASKCVPLTTNNKVMSRPLHDNENLHKPPPLQHGVISNGGGHGSSSRSSYEEGHVVPIEYFPSSFSQDDDKVFSENNGQQESKNVTFPNPPPFPTDVQRSSSLTRGRKSGQDLLPFSRVSARGPQTRSVYDLRGEDAQATYANDCFQKVTVKSCGHSCLIEADHVCCLCKKNASWTFSGDGQDLVACWTKGCYVCRRRVSETNQLSTVSRPRAELSSNPTSKTHCNDIDGLPVQQNSSSPKHSRTSPSSSKSRVSSSLSSKREKSCCVM